MPQAPEIKVAVPEIEKPSEYVVLPDPVPIATRKIAWVVLTSKTVPEAENWAYTCLTFDNYEDLALTRADTTRWIEEAMWRLRFYKKQLDGEEDEPE